MRILITGASGMVGRNLIEAFGERGSSWQLLTPSRQMLNLLSAPDVFEYLHREKPDLVIHCAGIVGGIQANLSSPAKFLAENTVLSFNVIQGAFAAGVRRLINLGSSCMYPKFAQNPLREEDILTGALEPTNEGYALAKICAAKLCEYINRQDPDFLYKTLIPCNLFGKFDKFDPQNSHLIPAIIHKVHQAKCNNDSEVEIWGDGTARREFMYCGDLAEFIFNVVERVGDLPQVLNVGTGRDYSVNEHYEIVANVIGYTGTFRHNLDKPVGMSQKLVSTKLLSSYGWSPSTSLEEGIGETYKFYLESVR